MTDVNPDANLETETVAVPKKQYDEMVEKIGTTSQDKANLINEIKELRESKQLSDAQAEDLRKKLENRVEAPGEILTTEKVAEMAKEAAKQILSERDGEAVKQNRAEALEQFLRDNPEFQPSNDEGGIKFAALERKMARFNLSGVTSKAAYLDSLEDARKLLVGNEQTQEFGRDPNPLAPDGNRNAVKVPEVKDAQLSVKELRIIQETFGGDKARYLKIKEKRPEYVKALLEFGR